MCVHRSRTGSLGTKNRLPNIAAASACPARVDEMEICLDGMS